MLKIEEKSTTNIESNKSLRLPVATQQKRRFEVVTKDAKKGFSWSFDNLKDIPKSKRNDLLGTQSGPLIPSHEIYFNLNSFLSSKMLLIIVKVLGFTSRNET